MWFFGHFNEKKIELLGVYFGVKFHQICLEASKLFTYNNVPDKFSNCAHAVYNLFRVKTFDVPVKNHVHHDPHNLLGSWPLTARIWREHWIVKMVSSKLNICSPPPTFKNPVSAAVWAQFYIKIMTSFFFIDYRCAISITVVERNYMTSLPET